MKKIFKRALLGVAVAGVITGGVIWNQYIHRDELPDLSFPDLDLNRVAAKVSTVSGTPDQRIVLEPAGQSVSPSTPEPSSLERKQSALEVGASVYAGSEIRTNKGGIVVLKTQGQFFVSLEKDGVFFLKDVRTNADRTRHSIVWDVRQGLMRIKSFERDQVGKSWIEINTPHARIFLQDPEIGMELNADGHGRAWLNRGQGVILTRDGGRKIMHPKGLESL